MHPIPDLSGVEGTGLDGVVVSSMVSYESATGRYLHMTWTYFVERFRRIGGVS